MVFVQGNDDEETGPKDLPICTGPGKITLNSFDSSSEHIVVTFAGSVNCTQPLDLRARIIDAPIFSWNYHQPREEAVTKRYNYDLPLRQRLVAYEYSSLDEEQKAAQRSRVGLRRKFQYHDGDSNTPYFMNVTCHSDSTFSIYDNGCTEGHTGNKVYLSTAFGLHTRSYAGPNGPNFLPFGPDGVYDVSFEGQVHCPGVGYVTYVLHGMLEKEYDNDLDLPLVSTNLLGYLPCQTYELYRGDLFVFQIAPAGVVPKSKYVKPVYDKKATIVWDNCNQFGLDGNMGSGSFPAYMLFALALSQATWLFKQDLSRNGGFAILVTGSYECSNSDIQGTFSGSGSVKVTDDAIEDPRYNINLVVQYTCDPLHPLFDAAWWIDNPSERSLDDVGNSATNLNDSCYWMNALGTLSSNGCGQTTPQTSP